MLPMRPCKAWARLTSGAPAPVRWRQRVPRSDPGTRGGPRLASWTRACSVGVTHPVPHGNQTLLCRARRTQSSKCFSGTGAGLPDRISKHLFLLLARLVLLALPVPIGRFLCAGWMRERPLYVAEMNPFVSLTSSCAFSGRRLRPSTEETGMGPLDRRATPATPGLGRIGRCEWRTGAR